jgi:hypothetical protein
MHLKETLLKLLKVIVADIRRSIIGIIVAGLILAAGGLHLLSKTVLNFSTQLLCTPTPLWVTIALILLCGLYMHLRVQRNLSEKVPSNPPAKTILIEVGRFKWKIDIYQTGEFKIHSAPYCRIHETRLIDYQRLYSCQDFGKDGCTSVIKKTELNLQFDIAHSFIEHRLRNK